MPQYVEIIFKSGTETMVRTKLPTSGIDLMGRKGLAYLTAADEPEMGLSSIEVVVDMSEVALIKTYEAPFPEEMVRLRARYERKFKKIQKEVNATDGEQH